MAISTMLIISREEARDKISSQIERGKKLLNIPSIATDGVREAEAERENWHRYNSELLRNCFEGDEIIDEYKKNVSKNYHIYLGDSMAFGYDKMEAFNRLITLDLKLLESILERLELYSVKHIINQILISLPGDRNNYSKEKKAIDRAIFIVHGKDEAAKQSLARFLEKLDLNPIILHEKPDKGKTIIEKFESYSKVSFAIVLLTPDDEGYPKGEKKKLNQRARQNVIFELGFFIGKLGRERVCALYKPDIELPSDYSGIIYKIFDDTGGWKLELAKEMEDAGIEIDHKKLLRS